MQITLTYPVVYENITTNTLAKLQYNLHFHKYF
ncbi:hypothetical protein SAMN05444280_10743 [Tangfeifania diversioriginum]|uniref:Uncharacterized protein n=1 Tax=Tangfeifania diversioriginum TaxID=1168035 RepID=A0A1M6ELZ6_9BACT|nr:hypothetical protein SAMN05444280_10743 [Tangfeifania diversioriginum]